MLFYRFLLADQKGFNHQSCNCSLLFLLLEDNILNEMFYHSHFQKIILKICLIFENLDELSDLNISFAHIFLEVIDIYSS